LSYTNTGGYADITGSDYLADRGLAPDRIAVTVLAARLAARLAATAAEEAYWTIRHQAIAELRRQGQSTRDIARTLSQAGAQRSQVNRELRKQPLRFAPEPAIDTLVQDAWAEDPAPQVHQLPAREATPTGPHTASPSEPRWGACSMTSNEASGGVDEVTTQPPGLLRLMTKGWCSEVGSS
jgi:hypothetical protein